MPEEKHTKAFLGCVANFKENSDSIKSPEEACKRWDNPIYANVNFPKSCEEINKEYLKVTKELEKLKGKKREKKFAKKLKLLKEMEKKRCSKKDIKYRHHSVSWHSCVERVRKQPSAISPEAICSAQVGW